MIDSGSLTLRTISGLPMSCFTSEKTYWWTYRCLILFLKHSRWLRPGWLRTYTDTLHHLLSPLVVVMWAILSVLFSSSRPFSHAFRGISFKLFCPISYLKTFLEPISPLLWMHHSCLRCACHSFSGVCLCSLAGLHLCSLWVISKISISHLLMPLHHHPHVDCGESHHHLLPSSVILFYDAASHRSLTTKCSVLHLLIFNLHFNLFL